MQLPKFEELDICKLDNEELKLVRYTTPGMPWMKLFKIVTVAGGELVNIGEETLDNLIPCPKGKEADFDFTVELEDLDLATWTERTGLAYKTNSFTFLHRTPRENLKAFDLMEIADYISKRDGIEVTGLIDQEAVEAAEEAKRSEISRQERIDALNLVVNSSSEIGKLQARLDQRRAEWLEEEKTLLDQIETAKQVVDANATLLIEGQ